MTKIWFSAAELAELALPGLSASKRKINRLAEDGRWALRVDADGAPLARTRSQRGGGLEYHISLLPPASAMALQKRVGPSQTGVCAAHASPATSAGQLWTWYDRQSATTKAEALRRVAILQAAQTLERAGVSRTTAVAAVAGERGVGSATIWNWLSLVAGADRADWLPHLAPRRSGGGCEAEIDRGVWQAFTSNYLRPEKPTMATSYRLAKRLADATGAAMPCLKTFQRKLEREIDGRVILLRREGQEALRRSMPAQKRTVADLHAMEIVNIDGHLWDVMVRWPATPEHPQGKIARPMMVAIQDIYSRKFLAWRVGQSESNELVRLTCADLFAKWGIPNEMLSDNGRAFASKQQTGGAAYRNRGKIRDDDAEGILTALGILVHFAKPYRGQSKPIERGFKDFCDAIAKMPEFEGAYTGNSVEAKPENYGNAAVPLDLFVAVVSHGIAEHNTRTGRRTEMALAAGKASLDDVFNDSYARSIIRKATAEQLRLALTVHERVTVNRTTGHIELFGNRYWSDDLGALAGQRVTVRFDPAALHESVHVYTAKGFVGTVPVLAPTGFRDTAAAKSWAKLQADRRKAVKHAEKMSNLISATELAALLPAYEDEINPPQPAVIRPVRLGRTAAALKLVPDFDSSTSTAPAFIDRFAAAERRLRVVE